MRGRRRAVEASVLRKKKEERKEKKSTLQVESGVGGRRSSIDVGIKYRHIIIKIKK